MLCHLCKGNTLKVAKYGSQSVFKAQTRDLVRQAGLVSYGVELPDLYIDLVLSQAHTVILHINYLL